MSEFITLDPLELDSFPYLEVDIETCGERSTYLKYVPVEGVVLKSGDDVIECLEQDYDIEGTNVCMSDDNIVNIADGATITVEVIS